MRGEEVRCNVQKCCWGITPAHAGRRQPGVEKHRPGWDHPRACGEKDFLESWKYKREGSPPRMRGEGFRLCFRRNSLQDHPRACGEKSFQLQCHVREEGSPPRMRGEGLNIIRILVCRRITPAHAGRRQYAELANNKGEDHPRACGEKLSTALKRRQRTGSPPRMRGEENPVTAGLLALRITPAHAGRS